MSDSWKPGHTIFSIEPLKGIDETDSDIFIMISIQILQIVPQNTFVVDTQKNVAPLLVAALPYLIVTYKANLGHYLIA